jgi:DNA topoisomerase-1
MQIAQKLYEGMPLEDQSTPVALITYMRTDSSRIADVAIKDVRSFIKSTYGNTYLPPKSRVYSKEKAQDAHEAIRPVDVTRTPDDVAPYLDARTLKLYRLIWNRFVACQMKPAEYAQRQVVINADPYTFKATGSSLLFDGFLNVYNTEEEEKNTSKIPSDIAEKMALELKKVDPKQHFTQPPARYTEASLVKKLEKEGIGRPSTYATILKRIQERAYTNLDKKKRFVPTELGFTVTRLLKKHLQKIMDVSFTANMEEDLDKVAHGDIERDKVLNDFYTDFSEMLKSFDSEIGKKQTEPTDIACPECKDTNVVIRHGKAGAFLGCPNYPDCTHTANFERTEDGNITVLAKKSAEEIAEERKKNETSITCPECKEGILVIRSGRSGPFLGCGKFPKCRYTANFKRSEESDEIELIENKKPTAKPASKKSTKKKSTSKQASTKKSSTSKTTGTKQTKTTAKKSEEKITQ